jgi:hypothetical protein
LAPVAPDGSLLQKDEAPPRAMSPAPEAIEGHAKPLLAHPFSNTLFDAALDAARGVAWRHAEQLESSAEGCDRWWTTQQRHLATAVRLLGVGPGLTEDQRHPLAEVLSVPALVLIEAAKDLAHASGYVACGKAVVSVLDRIPLHRAYLAERIAHSGFLASLWLEPLRWVPERSRFLRESFQTLRTRGPPAAG